MDLRACDSPCVSVVKTNSPVPTLIAWASIQVTSPVLWENTMELVLSKDFEKAYELGPGKVTAGILKRFSKTAECINVEV